jgi:predicted PurR-regulated permease PerM
MANSARRDLHVPMTTILKLIGSGFGLWAVWLLWPEFLLFMIAILLAITLHPAVVWMERKRVARSISVLVIASSALALVALFLIFLLPPLTTQMTHLLQDIPAFRGRVLDRIPARYPLIQAAIREIFEWSAAPKTITLFERSFAWGQSAVSGLVTAAVVVVLTLYLLLDGKSLYAWVLAFVPRTYREKVATTMDEVSHVVHAYVSAQVFVAMLFALFSAGLLTILGVPAAAPLAVIAGLCNVIPVLGIVIASAPAVLLAFAVSPSTAAVVAVGYLAYHLVELYFILPRIYGNKLKMSTLAVLLALIVGGKLQGMIGALLVLPFVAAYPIIERHWLGGLLHSRVLTDHKALAKAAETGSDVAIDAVISGEKHASEGFAGPASTGVSTR